MADYAAHLIDNDEDITAHTYSGLLKAARRWHQTEQLERVAIQIQEQIDRQEGWVQCWNSLVDSMSIPHPDEPDQPDITIVPLYSTPELLREGRHMNHCVGTYTHRCSNGASRVFSIRQGDTTIATTELSLRGGRWQVAQTRAWHNHDAPEIAHHAAKAVSRAYQAKWKESADAKNRHRSWLQHPETGSIKQKP